MRSPLRNPLRLGLVAAALLFGVPVTAAYVMGSRLPAEQEARAAIRLRQGPMPVWSLLTRWSDQPEWRSDVAAFTALEPIGDAPAFRLVSPDGDETEVGVIAFVPPRSFALRVEGEHFSGTQTVELVKDGLGTAVIVSKRGEIANPLTRLMADRTGGLETGVEEFLVDLAGALGDKPELVKDAAEVASLRAASD